MPDISKITLPSGTTYDLKDAYAREQIEALSGTVTWLGVTTTPLSDGATTNPITIGGESKTAVAGDVAAYGELEFVFNGTKWQEFGSTGSLKALAFKDSASGNYTPAGNVSKPTFTGTEGNVSVSGTPSGNVAISVGSGTTNYTPAGNVSKPTFSGTAGNVSVSGTPSGNVTISTGTGTANYTPAGNISKPNVTVTPSTTTVNSITDVGTLPSLGTTVENENLTLSWSAGTLPTKGSDTDVMTGATAALASAPTFTGTGAELKATFSGGSMTSTGTFTPAGEVSQPIFNGTAVDLEAEFTGTSMNSTGKFTPSGDVSKPTFTGTQGTVTVS